ncbi:MAG TPA: PilZ domain-containing protein, partial [Terriglobales bacterium]|nr:PilZ domain-containing protein [Terriglobales bacterium]
VKNADAEARRKTALGLSDLADLYGRIGHNLLQEAISACGEQLQVEAALDLQTLLGAALVRLAQEAGTRPDFPALRQAMTCVEKIETERPLVARDIRRRIAVESRLRKFISDAARADSLDRELVPLLQQNRRAASEELAALFSRTSRRGECDRLVELARELGPEAIGRLRELLRARPAHEAIATVGLLAHLDATALLEWLPRRLPEWSRSQHDAVVRQIAASGVPERARLLVTILEQLDPSVAPEVIDEIGMTGDRGVSAVLQQWAHGELPAGASPYLQVKAIEALARLRDADSLPLLRLLLQSRSLLGWKQPREIRVVAAQALHRLDPEFLRGYLPKSGIPPLELEIAPLDPEPQAGWVRQRRYPRVLPGVALSAMAVTQHGRYPLQIKTLSMGGGLGMRDGRSQLGMEAVLDLQLGLRHLRSQVWLRELDARHVGFEIVDIDLDDRAKLRKLLLEQMQRVPAGVLAGAQAPARSAVQVS